MIEEDDMCFRPTEISLPRKCAKCGTLNDSGATVCKECGEAIPEKGGPGFSGGAPGSPAAPNRPAAPGAPSAPGAPKGVSRPVPPKAPGEAPGED